MLDHLDDLASDFSAVHGITDMMTLPGPAFLALAWRIGSYQGVIRDLITAQAVAQHQDGGPQVPQGLGNLQFEQAAGESFESRMARAVPATAANTEAMITAAMTAAR